jgi:hypothetical protein
MLLKIDDRWRSKRLMPDEGRILRTWGIISGAMS